MAGLVAVYVIECPHCGHKIALLETMLERIIHYRLVPDTDVSFPKLVCSGCKRGFRYNYEGRSPQARIPEYGQTQGQESPVAYFVKVRCDKSNCGSPVEFVRIHDADTSEEERGKEVPQWNVSDFLCPNGHTLLPKVPEIVSSRLLD